MRKEAPIENDAKKPKDEQRRLIIIDTDEGMRRLISNFVAQVGFAEVMASDDSREAWDSILKKGCSLLIMDWKGPLSKGATFYKKFRSHQDLIQVPILMTSGFVTPNDLAAVGNDPYCAFITKPFTRSLLMRTLSNSLKIPEAVLDESSGLIGSGTSPSTSGRGETAIRGDRDLRIQRGSGRTPKSTPGTIVGRTSSERDLSLGALTPTFGKAESEAPNTPSVGTKVRSSDPAFHFGNPPQKLSPPKGIPETVLIVDSDAAICGLIGNYMTSLGCREFIQCDTTEKAWTILRTKVCDLIIMDWRQKDFPGIRLYNRIRSDQRLARVPVVVLSGFPNKEDFRLLEECGWTKVVGKPLQMSVFKNSVENTIKKSSETTDIANTVIDAIEMAVAQNQDFSLALKGFMDSGKDILNYVIAAGQYYFAKGIFQDAEKLFKVALKVSPGNITAMTELAKILHRTNRPAEALRFLEQASAASPQNIERLCLLGEVGLDLSDAEIAQEYFANALQIDEENPVAQAGMKVSDNLADHVKSYGPQSLSQQFTSNLNIVGITLVRNHQIDRGIEQYRAAMSFVQNDQVRARLYFNLGMAYLRKRAFDEAEKWFLAAKVLVTDGSFAKPEDYLQRIQLIKSGVLSNSDKKDTPARISASDDDTDSLEGDESGPLSA